MDFGSAGCARAKIYRGTRSSVLTIRQAGESDLRHRARLQSRDFERPIYYAIRIGKWDGPDGWELEMNHDKLYLSNPTEKIGHFAISHGFDRVTPNRAMERGDTDLAVVGLHGLMGAGYGW